MKLKKFIFVSACLFWTCMLYAQNPITAGKIRFERKENLHKRIEEMPAGSMPDLITSRMPKYRTDVFELQFNTHFSWYKIEQEDESPMAGWWRVASANTVYSRFQNHTAWSEKTIYERTYQIADSMPQVRWKILDDYRDIAGYSCRKAATIIHDSIYVIAFYTEAIAVSGGPESFNGLPGMILGLVVPRLHMTWFATSVESLPLQDAALMHKESKQKTVRIAEYIQELKAAVKDWGEYGPKLMWNAIL